MRETALDIRPENFAPVPGAEAGTKSYVYISNPRACDGRVVQDLTGYDYVSMAQRHGLYPISSAEWGSARQYFQDNPKVKFGGMCGKEIEESFISGDTENTSTFLSFRGPEGFPVDTHDLLKDAGFDGRIALIDFPYVIEGENIFIPSPRIRIVDVTGKIPLESGYIMSYDEGLGVATAAVPEDPRNPEPPADSEYRDAFWWIKPEGTRHVYRGNVLRHHGDDEKRFNVCAFWGPLETDPEANGYHSTTRLSREDDPLGEEQRRRMSSPES